MTTATTTEDKNPNIDILNQYYTDGDEVDKDVYSEMRSNLLLVAGEHYAKKDSTFYKRIRDSKELSKEQKLRITKNHVRKICQLYSNNISSMNPSAGFTPKDENATHDQKAATLHHSVWRDAVERYCLNEKAEEWVDSYVQIGELHVKLFYDPMAGPIHGYEPMVDEVTGQPKVGPTGEQMPDESKPIAKGEFVFEEVYGFNLLRPKECRDLRKAEWLGVRKMVSTKDAKKQFASKLEYIQTDQDETFKVFDITRGGYRDSNNQTMFREYYFRPSLSFPEGYFYITTSKGILAEGKLPGGKFPIVSALFDRIKTTPRGRGPVKTMRPYQAEINRAASKQAEHQITLGDDKLLIQNGTKVSAGTSLPGIRSVGYTGAEPKILAGRDGSQYLATIEQNIKEMYQVMMVAEDMAEQQQKLDPVTLLYQAASKKKKFQRYIRGFEHFYVELVKLYLALAKIHLPDDAVIWAIGKSEQVNISEFRALDDICYEINVEAQADDVETKIGKQIMINHTIQYAGSQLGKDDIGKILRNSPYANLDESMDDLTIDYDTAINDILALDRGEKPPINQYDKHEYMINKLVFRMRKADFKFLSPEIQNNYQQKISLHEQFKAKQDLELQRAEQGFIPTGGTLIGVDFWVNQPGAEGQNKTVRAKIPYQSVEWLLKQLEAQGASQASMEGMNAGAQQQIGNMISTQGNQPIMQPQPNGMGNGQQ